jgi:hypothetical protein
MQKQLTQLKKKLCGNTKKNCRIISYISCTCLQQQNKNRTTIILYSKPKKIKIYEWDNSIELQFLF